MPRKAIAPVDHKYKTEDTTSVALDEIVDANAEQKRKESKRDERFQQDIMYGQKAYKRNVHDTIQERDTRYARLHTFGGATNVQMFWDFHPEAIQKQLFKLRIGDQEVVLSATELQKYLRWV